MNKSTKTIFLLISLMLAGCGENKNSSISNNVYISSNSSASSSNSSTSSFQEDNNKTYKVTFKDGEEVIYEAEGKSGEFVEIPDDLVGDDSRYIFKGWEGIDEYDRELGKIEIFEDDQVFNAIWSERFGTETQFTATKRRSSFEINLDGELDDAYNDAAKIPITTITKGETNTTAEAYLMWDESYFYVFVDVKDEFVFSMDKNSTDKQSIEHYDSIELWIDLLHDDSLAIPNYKEGWGGVYRGEPGPMCEAHYKINAGFVPTAEKRFDLGSEACWDGWWSNASNEDGVSAGYSKITEYGYTVEYKINATNENIPDYLRLKENEQIGVGIKIYDKNVADEGVVDKTEEAPNAVAMEYINGNMSGPKKLSNVNLILNSQENK